MGSLHDFTSAGPLTPQPEARWSSTLKLPLVPNQPNFAKGAVGPAKRAYACHES